MKSSFSNILIIFLLVIILIGSCILTIDYIRFKIDSQNEVILTSILDIIKGNLSLDEVENLDINSDIKEYLISYYKDTFYLDSELIPIYEDYDFFIEHRDELKEIQMSYEGSFLDMNSGYFYTYCMINPESSDTEEIKFSELANIYSYLDEDKTDDFIVLQEGILYLRPEDIKFNDIGNMIVHYKGLSIIVNRYVLDKSIRNDRLNDIVYKNSYLRDNYATIKNGKVYTILSNSTQYNFVVKVQVEERFGKIIKVSIT